MLTVVTPATSRRLTTVANVRTDLSLPGNDPTDTKINRWIDQASATVEKYCRRVFARETVVETFRACDLNTRLSFSRGPVTEIEEVLWNGVVVAPAEFEIDRGSLWRLGTSQNPMRHFWGGSALSVRYVAGYVLPSGSGPEALPFDVELGVIRLIGAAFSLADRDPLIKSEDVEGLGSRSFWVPGKANQLSSPEAEALLKPYKMMRIR